MHSRIVNALNAFFGTEIFSFLVPGYIPLLALGIVFGGWLGLRNVKSAGLSTNRAAQAALVGYFFALFGARAVDVLINFSTYRHDLLNAFVLWRGGMVAYGGFIGGISAFILMLRFSGERVVPYLDCGAPAMGIGIAFTRIGCFMNGCCYGNLTTLPWGVRFPSPSAAFSEQVFIGNSKMSDILTGPLHPTQLYAALAGVLLFVVGMFWFRHRRFPGEVFWKCTALYGTMRFLIEWMRSSMDRGFIGPMHLSQWISLLLAVFSVLMVILLNRKQRPEGSP